MKIKRISMLALVVILLSVWGYRVYAVNKGVATDYDIRTYQVGDVIPLDEVDVTIKSVTYGDAVKKEVVTFASASVVFEVTNRTDHPVEVGALVTTKIVHDKYDFSQTMEGTFDREMLRAWPAHKTDTFTLKYDIPPKHKDKHGKIVILPDRLYEELEKKHYKEGKRYGITVEF